MLNDSYWQKRRDGTAAVLWSADGELIALIEKVNNLWECTIYPELIAKCFCMLSGNSIEEIEWQITLYIYNRCNDIANQLHKIRDHLPSIHELAERVRRKGEKQ